MSKRCFPQSELADGGIQSQYEAEAAAGAASLLEERWLRCDYISSRFGCVLHVFEKTLTSRCG